MIGVCHLNRNIIDARRRIKSATALQILWLFLRWITTKSKITETVIVQICPGLSPVVRRPQEKSTNVPTRQHFRPEITLEDDCRSEIRVEMLLKDKNKKNRYTRVFVKT